VARDGKWGLIDKTGKEVVPPKYSYIINYYWGDRTVFAAGGRWTEEYGKPILVDAKWGLLDDKGQELIPAKFDRIYPWGEKYYQAAKDMEAVYPRP